jgi:glycosyltransferase involved in cell wall biosynthesis
LRERNINLHVFTALQDDLPEYEVVEGTPVHRIPLNNNSTHPAALLLNKFVRLLGQKKLQKPDLVHILKYDIRGAPAVFYTQFGLGLPCMHTATMLPMQRKPYSIKMQLSLYLQFAPLNTIVTSSTVMTDAFTGFGISKKKFKIIPNGVDIERFKPVSDCDEKKSIREQLGFKQDEKIILYVGSINKRKGTDILFSAWPEIASGCPTAHLVLVGPRPDSSAAFTLELNRLVSDSSGAERITYTDTVPNVEQYLKSADLFVFPSRLEGMANVVSEAMSSGLPCILTPYIGLPKEFGSPGTEYVLAQPDPGKIALTVLDLLGDEARQRKLGLAARSWTEKNLDVDISVDNYAQAYRKLAAKSL